MPSPTKTDLVKESLLGLVKKPIQTPFYRQLFFSLIMNSRSGVFSFLLIAILAISSLSLIFATISFGLAQSGTNASGTISQDTTWTQAKSPYNLTENVVINTGVTLTIEAGVTLNLDSNYIIVQGTLRAIGDTMPIEFNNGGAIIFQNSTGWNQATRSGIISGAGIGGQISITDSSPMISDCNMSIKKL